MSCDLDYTHSLVLKRACWLYKARLMFRFTSACCGTKGPCPGQTFDPSSNIQISVNSSRFFSRFIARSNDLDSSKTSMRILYQGGDIHARGFFLTQANKKHIMATYTEQARLKVPQKTLHK